MHRSRLAIRRRAAWVAGGYVIVASAWIVLSDLLSGAILSTPEALTWANLAKGMAFVGVTGAILFGLMLTTGRPSPLDRPSSGAAPAVAPAVIFILASGMILATGYATFQRQHHAIRAEKGRELAAIADLKVGQISSWMKERRADAEVLRRDSLLVSAVARWIADGRPDDELAAAIRDRLDALASEYGYSGILLVGSDRRELLRAGSGDVILHPEVVQTIEEAWARNAVMVLDLHRSLPHLPVEFDLVVPLSGAKGPMAALYVASDPRRHLYPLVGSWPTPSPSAETLLVRRDGEDALFLNAPRHSDVPPLTQRLPLSRTDIPASPAARGEETIMDGIDYRGLPVLAATRQVPGMPWGMVAKIDRSEVFAPIRRLALMSGLTTAAVWLATVTGLFFWWRRERDRHAAALLLADEKRRALTHHFDFLSRHANDIILLVDAEGRIVEANDRAVESYGHARDELVGMDVRQLRAPSALPSFSAFWEASKRPEGSIARTLHRRADGTEFPVEISNRPLEIGGNLYHQAIIRDISDRVAFEQEISRLNTMYLMLSRTNETILRAKSADELFAAVCAIATDVGGFLLAWIGLIEEGSDALRVLALAGPAREYAEGIHVTIRADRPSGQGPTGIAIRENRTYVCSDFQNDPATGPWRDRAARHGIKASAAFPLRRKDRAFGALTVYTGDSKLFGEEVVALLEEMAADLTFALEVLEVSEDRRRLLTELEERVRQRTADLEAANAEMEAFTYSVSHDLRGPLRALDGYSQAILEDLGPRLDDKGQLYLKYLREGAQEMGELIDALLRLSRSTRGELVWGRVDLSALASDVVQDLRDRDPDRAVTVEIMPGIVLDGDERLLRVLLDNLLGNAWKYTRRTAEARIALAAERRDGTVVCHVRDNGVGFDMAYADKLFKPFRRLHRKNEFEGSGIGLSTVERIVRRHGGRVWAEGAVGKGATFHFELPSGRDPT
jgi:PAS domain S-box-containing protein